MPYGRKPCPVVGCPEIISTAMRRCPTHSASYEQQRGTRQQRGYDADHDRERAAWQDRIDRGEQVYCARGCGSRILGRAWHLDHDDDRTGWLGPSCIPCNTRDGAAKTRAQNR